MSRSFRYLFVLALFCLLVCGVFVFLLFTVFSDQELIVVTQTVWAFSDPNTPHRTSLPTSLEINLIRLGLGIGLVLIGLTGWYFQRKQQLVTSFLQQTKTGFQNIFRGLKQSYRQLTPFEKRLVAVFFLLITALRLYYAIVFPLHPDESVSAIAFADRGILAVTGLYHIPNNHIFYNLIAWVFSWFISDYFWLSRVPALVISLVFLVFSFGALLRFVSFPVAFLTTVLFGLHHNSLYYATHGRGYYLLTFWAVIAALALIQLIQKRSDFYWLLFVMASVLGFYTAISFVYTFAGFLIFGVLFFLIRTDWLGILKLTFASVLTGICTLLLWLPLFILSGPETLFNHALLEPLTLQAFLVKLPFFLRYIIGACLGQETIGFYIYLLLIVAFGIIWLKKAKNKRLTQTVSTNFFELGWLALAVGIAPVFIIVAQRVFPYERLLIYKSFFDLLVLSWVVVWALHFWLKDVKKIRAAVIVLGLVFGAYHTYKAHFILNLDQRTCPPDTIQRALRQYGDPDKPMEILGNKSGSKRVL